MCNAFERMVAFRYLRARREEGFISIVAMFSLIGIALGVATLIVVLAVMNGVRGELVKSIIGLEGHVTIYDSGRAIDGYDALIRDLLPIEGVKTALPKIDGQVMLSFRGNSVGAMVASYRSEDLDKKQLLAEKIKQSLPQPGEIIIGSRMAERLNIKPGDQVMLISPEGRATVIGPVPRVKTYRVASTFSVGMFSYDAGMILMPFADAQLYFKLADDGANKVSAIDLMLENPEQAEIVAKKIRAQLPQMRIYDWKTSNKQIFEAVIVQRNVMFVILMLIILVASFNIISSLVMLVKEKGGDIAILRTMGARQSAIMRIFFLCGASVGFIGTAIGVVLGLLIAFNTETIQRWLEKMVGHKLLDSELYFLSQLPARVDMAEVIGVIVLSLAISFLATLYPARRAASIDPAEALRYE